MSRTPSMPRAPSALRVLSVLALATAFAVATPSVAHADEDAPAPKKRTIKLKKRAGKAAAPKASPRSPMPVIEKWLRGKLGGSMPATGEDPMGGMLKQWFEGGADVPMADLRDALRTEGWNADSMRAWMMGEMARTGAWMQMHPQFSARTFGPFTTGPRTFTWFGQGPGMRGHGMRGHGMRGHGWRGHGMGGHGRHGHGWHGRHGMRGGMGPRWRMRRGFGGHGFGGQGFGGRAFGGHPFGGQGMGGAPFGGVPFGGHAIGGQPHTHSQQRAFIYWNDGSGWQHREIPGGANPFGHALPFPMPGMGAPGTGAPGIGGPGGGHHGMGGPNMGGRAPVAPGQPGTTTRRFRMVVPGGPGMPGGPGQPGQPGGVGRSFDIQGLEQLQQLLEQMKKNGLDPNAAGGIELDGAGLQQLLEMLKQFGGALPGPAAPQPPAPPRKVKVRVAQPKGAVNVQEVELEQEGGVVKLRPVPRDDR